MRLPAILDSMLQSEIWPKDRESMDRQVHHALVPLERVREHFPEAVGFFLYPPPFETVAALLLHPESREWFLGRSATIDPERAFVIGDLGVGSDAPIALDYRSDPPSVVVLRAYPTGNLWEQTWDSLDELVRELRIGR
jgi:hypothetical protein